jgi:hypothetical protein
MRTVATRAGVPWGAWLDGRTQGYEVSGGVGSAGGFGLRAAAR